MKYRIYNALTNKTVAVVNSVTIENANNLYYISAQIDNIPTTLYWVSPIKLEIELVEDNYEENNNQLIETMTSADNG